MTKEDSSETNHPHETEACIKFWAKHPQEITHEWTKECIMLRWYPIERKNKNLGDSSCTRNFRLRLYVPWNQIIFAEDERSDSLCLWDIIPGKLFVLDPFSDSCLFYVLEETKRQIDPDPRRKRRYVIVVLLRVLWRQNYVRDMRRSKRFMGKREEHRVLFYIRFMSSRHVYIQVRSWHSNRSRDIVSIDVTTHMTSKDRRAKLVIQEKSQ